MQGIRLLVGGCVLCAALVAPAALLASEGASQPQPPEGDPGTATVIPVEPGQLPADAVPAPEPPPPSADVDPAPEPPRKPKSGNRKARAAATRTVAMRDIKFKPKKITIDPGDTVRWRNEDEVEHDAIGEDSTFKTPLIDGGETSSHTFEKAGSYPYFCSIHQGMTGTIAVGSSSGGGSGGSSGDGSGGTSGSGSTGSSSSTGSTGSFGSTSSGSTSSLPSTGHEALWLAAIGAALLWLGAASAVIVVAQRREHERRGR